jgi:hypothetical protein
MCTLLLIVTVRFVSRDYFIYIYLMFVLGFYIANRVWGKMCLALFCSHRSIANDRNKTVIDSHSHVSFTTFEISDLVCLGFLENGCNLVICLLFTNLNC